MKKKFLVLCALFLFAVFAVHGQDTGGTADILPELPPEVIKSEQNVFYINTGAALNFGNLTADDYAIIGENGQTSLKTHLNMTKSFGPLFIVGQIADTIGLSSPDTFNLVELSLTPLFVIPQANLLAGVQLRGSFPFFNGRLIGTQAQMPDNVPLFNLASWGVTPGLRFTLPFKWGSLSGTALFPADRVLVTGDWNLNADFEIGVSTALGISGFVSPNFSFLQMGEPPEDKFTSFDVSIGYMKPGVPFSGSLMLTFPGSQEDGFKRFGMIINPAIHFYPTLQCDLWINMAIQRVGNGMGDKIDVLPTIGMTYHPPITSLPASETRETKQNTDEAQFTDVYENMPHEGGPENSRSDQKYISRWFIGLTGGYTNNELYTSAAERPFTEYKNGNGFEIAIPVRYQVNRWFAVQAEAQFIQKNYAMQRSGEYDWMSNTVTNSFIDFPLMANFSAGWDRFRVFANIGAYAGVWIYSHRKGTIAESTYDVFHPDYNPPDITYYYYKYDYDEKMEFDSRRDARFDGGLLAGIGAQIILPACTIFAEGRFNYGLTDLQQNYGYHMFPRMNSTFNARLGVLLNMDIFGRK